MLVARVVREHVARGVAREHFCAALKETLAAAHSRTNYAQNVVRARARGERAGAQVKCIKYWGTNVSGMHAWLGGNMNERRMGFCVVVRGLLSMESRFILCETCRVVEKRISC